MSTHKILVISPNYVDSLVETLCLCILYAFNSGSTVWATAATITRRAAMLCQVSSKATAPYSAYCVIAQPFFIQPLGSLRWAAYVGQRLSKNTCPRPNQQTLLQYTQWRLP